MELHKKWITVWLISIPRLQMGHSSVLTSIHLRKVDALYDDALYCLLSHSVLTWDVALIVQYGIREVIRVHHLYQDIILNIDRGQNEF